MAGPARRANAPGQHTAMFVGHLAVAFATKPKTPEVSLGWLVAAVSTLDLIWPLMLLFGLEQVAITPGVTAFTPLTFVSYPWTHSLAMAIVWGLALGGLGRLRGFTIRTCAWLAAMNRAAPVAPYPRLSSYRR